MRRSQDVRIDVHDVHAHPLFLEPERHEAGPRTDDESAFAPRYQCPRQVLDDRGERIDGQAVLHVHATLNVAVDHHLAGVHGTAAVIHHLHGAVEAVLVVHLVDPRAAGAHQFDQLPLRAGKHQQQREAECSPVFAIEHEVDHRQHNERCADEPEDTADTEPGNEDEARRHGARKTAER